jgi:fatty-acyl-CoA synthase
MELNIRLFLERARRYFPDNEIVSRLPDNSIHRYTYRDLDRRARCLASQLQRIGVRPGDRLATLAWNNYRHFELYFAVPCAGFVLHTINLRLSDEHVAYIINHSADTVIFVDPDMLPMLERISEQLLTVQTFIVMASKVPETTLQNVLAYDDIVTAGNPGFVFEEVQERAPAAMCYTSATTGFPKGVTYSHRDIYLHTITECLGDLLDIRERDTILPVVPMFHVNAWGLPFAAACTGAKMVLPGERPTPDVILDLIEQEQVTFAAAAVSVGIDMMTELRQQRRDLSHMRALMLGGSATPAALMKFYLEQFNVPIVTAWGATELAPLATCVHIRRDDLKRPAFEQIPTRARQGIPLPGVELKVLDEGGLEVEWDDKSVGEIYVRTPWSASEYYLDSRTSEGFVEGFWRSGDMATVNAVGELRLVDRAKDLIKSGGEWISSVDLENALIAHPAVREATVVAVADAKWLERPCAYVVLEPDAFVSVGDLRQWLEGRFARWWVPDEFLFVESIPRTGVGKINKRLLRDRAPEDIKALSHESRES